MEWNWDAEVAKSLATSSDENGDYSFSGFSNMVEKDKTTAFSLLPESSSSPIIKRSRATYQSSHLPRCQVEGCNLDLVSAKDYHRRHRICVDHTKSPKVVVAGMERRFCQQCSRLHDLSEFDDRKRSCRRRLSAHNARRRRTQSEDIKFSSINRKAYMDFLVNPGVSNPSPNPTPQSSSNFNGGGIGMMSNGVLSDISSSFHGLMPRSISQDGLEANSSSVHTMEVNHSFSLEPTNSWGFNGRDEPSSFDQFIHGGLTQSGMPLDMQNTRNTQIPPHYNFDYFCSD